MKKILKTCMLCLMPRAEGEAACQICGARDFEPGIAGPAGDLALRLIVENRFDTAYASLEQLVASEREDAESTRRLAWLAYCFQDFRAVETWCHECERLDESSPEPHLLLGVVLMRAERWPESVEEFDAALKRQGLSPGRRAIVEDLKASAAANIPEW